MTHECIVSHRLDNSQTVPKKSHSLKKYHNINSLPPIKNVPPAHAQQVKQWLSGFGGGTKTLALVLLG